MTPTSWKTKNRGNLIVHYLFSVSLAILLTIWRYILWHLVYVDCKYKRMTVATNGPLFCSLFNLRARLRKKDVRFYYNKLDNIYIAKSQKYKRYFFSKSRTYGLYGNGIVARGISLGEVYFLPKIKFSDNDIVIDCGANVGDLKIYFEENKLNINYIGIEPSPKEYYCLSKNVAPSETYNVGLWNESGNLDFYVSSNEGDSSFFEPLTYTEKVTILTKRLDSFCDNHIRLLKIEAEGAEPEVLIGCEKLLNRVDYISADLGFERGLLQESTLVPVTNFLLKRNFELVDFSSPRIVALYKRVGLEY